MHVYLTFVCCSLISESLQEAKQQEVTCKQHIDELRKRKSVKLEEVKMMLMTMMISSVYFVP